MCHDDINHDEMKVVKLRALGKERLMLTHMCAMQQGTGTWHFEQPLPLTQSLDCGAEDHVHEIAPHETSA